MKDAMQHACDAGGSTPARTIPLWAIVGAAVFAAYLAFFVRPVFLNPAEAMAFPRYVSPATDLPIGADMRVMIDFSNAWLDGQAANFGNWHYPPLQRVLFLPLALFSMHNAFVVLTALNVLSFLSVILWLPLLVRREADRAAVVLVAATGLLSYGFQFELERGQTNVVAMALVAWALYLFHRRTGAWSRWGAYLLFTAAIQLKLFPAVFVFAFVRDARAWRQNVLRWAMLGGLNIACLFALGLPVYRKFQADVLDRVANFGCDPRNLSIKSYSELVTDFLQRRAHLHVTASQIALVCVAILAVGFLATFAWAWYRNGRASLKYVLWVCSLAALLVPAVSFDYKLPILTMAFAFLVAECDAIRLRERGEVWRLLLFSAFSLLYAVTLFPAVCKPKILMSSTPMLLGSCVVLLLLLVQEELALRRRTKDTRPGDGTGA